MKLTVLSTGSKANCYLLDNGIETLILDAGVPYGTIARRIEPMHTMVGCVVTHEHKDHAKCVLDLSMRGIKCIMSAGTAKACKAENEAVILPNLGSVEVGSTFTVKAFDTQHDSAEPFGFLIKSKPTGETILYATDTYYLKYKFPNVSYWIIECNYCDKTLEEQLDSNEINQTLYGRLLHSHMSLKRLKTTLEANDLRKTRKIVLVHMSNSRSDVRGMETEIEELTGVETVAAINGECISLEQCPF